MSHLQARTIFVCNVTVHIKCFSVNNFRLIYDIWLVHLLVCNIQYISTYLKIIYILKDVLFKPTSSVRGNV